MELEQITNEILSVLRQEPIKSMSWGAVDFESIYYEQMPALKFNVNGFLHKGTVIVALNEGEDLYEIYCLNEDRSVAKSRTEVYCYELMDILDRLIDQDCSREEYNVKIMDWFLNQ